MATCKKIEVDYFAKKAERPNDSIDVILNDDKRKTIEILDTTGSINDQGNNAIDQNLDDEDELHGEWEKEQLRIVEDYHSNSSLDAISSNEQCDSLEVKSESSTVKQNITSGSDKSHNTSNSSNRSMGLMYSSETDVDYNAAKKTNLSRKRSKSPDDSKAQSKKHKGFDDALKDLGKLRTHKTDFFARGRFVCKKGFVCTGQICLHDAALFSNHFQILSNTKGQISRLKKKSKK